MTLVVSRVTYRRRLGAGGASEIDRLARAGGAHRRLTEPDRRQVAAGRIQRLPLLPDRGEQFAHRAGETVGEPRAAEGRALSFRDVEDLLAERDVAVSYETVRRWVNHFGPMIASDLESVDRSLTRLGIPASERTLPSHRDKSTWLVGLPSPAACGERAASWLILTKNI